MKPHRSNMHALVSLLAISIISRFGDREGVVKGASSASYLSSGIELRWLDGTRKGKICATASTPEMLAAAKLWMQYSTRAWHGNKNHCAIPSLEEHAVLSQMPSDNESYESLCSAVIEPLSGVARHPFAHVWLGSCRCAALAPPMDTVDIFDVTYIIPYNNCQSRKPKPRTLFFDLGASQGFYGVPGGVPSKMPNHGGGITPSLPLFYRMYADRCLEFDEVFAWEPNTRVSPSAFWGELPAHIQAKVHFYNVPVTPTAFVEMLQAVAAREDFVAIKVDIDTPGVELEIVQEIVDKPELSTLVDELFFEYHFEFDGCDFGWGGVGRGTSVDAPLALLHKLRVLGVRAHFWI